MAVNPYTTQSISGYNSSPPSDDGSQTDANKVKWSSHKSKLGDPIKTLAEAINSQALSSFNTLALEDWSESTTTATIAESDWHNGIRQTATGRVIFPAPSSLENGWHALIMNGSTGVVQLQGTATGSFLDFNAGLASEVQVDAGGVVKVYNTATAFLALGLRSTATSLSTPVSVAQGGSGATNATDAQTNLSLVPGVDVQEWDADLDVFAGLVATNGAMIFGQGTNATATEWVAMASASDGDVPTADASEVTGWKFAPVTSSSPITVVRDTHTSSTTCGTVATGGTEIFDFGTQTLPTEGFLRVTVTQIEYDYAAGGGGGSAGIALETGASTKAFAQEDDNDGTNPNKNFLPGDAGTTSIIYNGPNTTAIFDITGNSFDTGSQGVKCFIGDEAVSGLASALTIDGASTTAVAILEIISAT